MTTIAPPPVVAAPAYPWIADEGDGTYRNPVIHADYSDPDVMRDGDDFWMTASSFNCTPALPILHSHDLVNWRLVGHALKNLPGSHYDAVRHGCGVWAPAIRKHASRFWIFFPMPDEGIFVITAEDPTGPWTEPHLLAEGKGLIDPCPLWDDDGQAYLVHAYARSRCGIKHRLRVCPMAPDASHLLGEGHVVFDDPERHPTLEGPKFHKRRGYYYISAPAGGVKEGWQVVLRSRHVYGPYENRIVLAQGTTPINGPHQGSLVDTAAGEWWFVHFQDADVHGRIIHLQPANWDDDWPRIGIRPNEFGVSQPVLRHPKPIVKRSTRIAIPPTSDAFEGPRLGVQWQWHANHRDDWWSLSARRGFLRLYAQPATQDLADLPNLLLQKFPSPEFSVETRIELSPRGAGASDSPVRAGLAVIGRTHAAVVLERGANGLRLLMLVNNRVAKALPVNGPAAHLRVEVKPGGVCRFAAEVAGRMATLGEPFQATPGVWIGAKVGLFCCIARQASSPVYCDVAPFCFGA